MGEGGQYRLSVEEGGLYHVNVEEGGLEQTNLNSVSRQPIKGLCGVFLPCILACRVAQDFEECCCVAFLPGSLLAMRTGIRERYHISGSVCDDWVAMCCCGPCSLCQMARELTRRK
nr:PREDICTED: cornifelin homolog A-like [Latimeria chalumnae]|eukprot:XP_014345776.1 PREDICTED: cornifelin homolog A-like [Latimeria chalumnae]